MTDKYDAFSDEDMAAIGRELMRAIDTYMPDTWHPMDCPSEVVGDLCNELDEVKAALAAAQEREAKLETVYNAAKHFLKVGAIGGGYRVLEEAVAALSQSSHEQARQADVTEDCGNCHRCLEGKAVCYGPYEIAEALTRMIVCPRCGNKRCPKATDHHLDCTGSNEPGQTGSIYAAAPSGKEGE